MERIAARLQKWWQLLTDCLLVILWKKKKNTMSGQAVRRLRRTYANIIWKLWDIFCSSQQKYRLASRKTKTSLEFTQRKLCLVVGKISHFIFKALIVWKMWKFRWHLKTIDLLNWTKCLRNECSVEIKGSNYNETFICFKKINALK
jgi:hypothetical protein